MRCEAGADGADAKLRSTSPESSPSRVGAATGAAPPWRAPDTGLDAGRTELGAGVMAASLARS
jgi:hypothetical protein